MASAPNNERRKRIAERGSDRMALITGRINALPPTAPSSALSPSNHNHIPRHTQSLSVAAGCDSDENHLPPRHQRPQSLTGFGVDYHEGVSSEAETKRSASLSSARLKHQGGFRYSNMDNFEFKPEEEPLTHDSDTTTDANNHVSESDGAKMKPPSVTSSAKKSSAHDTLQLQQPHRHNPALFSSRALNSCILASESTRALSSMIIALLVVFYYMISRSVLASRPLYILLLTDVTIVLARLFGGKAIVVMEESEGESVKAHGDGHNWGDAVKLLERGLVAYQAIRGVFIDCSIYIVIVVCGTSFM